MHKILRSSAIVAALWITACGGSTPPPNDAAGANNESSANSESGSESAALAAERKNFMAECNSSSNLEAFCQCSWDSVSKKTTAAERQDVNNPNTKKALASLPQDCGDKMPPEMVKQNYVQACAEVPAMKSFCECSYTFLDRKGLLKAGADAVSRVEGEMKAACAKELQEFARMAFMEGCSQNQTTKVCDCALNSLTKQYGDKLWPLLESGSEQAREAVRNATTSCKSR